MSDFYDPFDWFWLVGEEEAIYSSAAGRYVDVMAPEVEATRIASHEELVKVLRTAGVPPFHIVPTYTIVRRLEEAGKLAAAEAALELDQSAKWRFMTADSRGGINADDAESRAFLEGIGVDPDAILAQTTKA